MLPPPDADQALAILTAIGSQPTVPYHETRVLSAIVAQLTRLGLPVTRDEYGQVSTHISRGEAKKSLVLVAHADHPGFEVTDVDDGDPHAGWVRVLGSLKSHGFAERVRVLLYGNDGDGLPAVLTDFTPDADRARGSTGRCRIRADRELEVGDWAVLDMPAFERAGDELRMRAADDLAGCAMLIATLAHLRQEPEPFDVHALFTRAEEVGLFGARIIAEDGALPRESIIVSVEASNAAFAPVGAGIVIRAGDLHNTFDNEAERFLRVAQERLADADPPVPSQRRLLAGGTCEASVFVRLGWRATGVALPLLNYHNWGDTGAFLTEIVRLSDLLSGVSLLAEAAVAAGQDATETWWPNVRQVPTDIRERLKHTNGAAENR